MLRPAARRAIGIGAALLLAALAAACGPQAGTDSSHARVAPVASPSAVPAAKPFPKGSLYAKSASFQLAVYALPKPSRDPQQALRELLEGESRTFHRIGRKQQASPAPTLLVAEPAIEEYAPPTPDVLSRSGHGLSPQEVAQVQGSRHVITLTFETRTPGKFEGLRAAYRLAGALAEATGGLVWDEETRELFSLAAWNERRIASWSGDVPHVPDHMVIHVYANPELLRSVTLGMAKLGLPDVFVDESARSASGSIGSLINLACQTMAERGELEAAGRLPVEIGALADRRLRKQLEERTLGKPQRKAVLDMSVGTREEGDADNRLLEIAFGSGLRVQERQNALLEQMFGSEDAVSSVEHDEALLAASARAKREIVRRLKPLFRKGLAPGARLLVKAPFEIEGGGNEWMWIEVVGWKGTQVEGLLMNEPEYVALAPGARVVVAETALFDYMHYLPDGTTEGNETGRIVQAREGARAH